MRIAYVAIHLESKFVMGGVGRKIQTQIKLWKEYGHQVHLFLLTPDQIQISDASIFRFSASVSLPVLKSVVREWSRSQSLKNLIDAIREYRPDVIYFRYGLYAYPLHCLFEIAPALVEVNTDDVLEYRHRGSFFYWINYLSRGLIFSRSAGIVPISTEIAKLSSISKYQKPVMVIPNGFDMEDTHPLPAPKNKQPRVSFVGNMEAVWNGVDKLILFAQKNPDIMVDIIGMSADQIQTKEIPDNIVCHGLVSLQEVRNILSQSDVSISALALHRKPSFENSLLKVRESLGYGIPTILAYHDTDVSGKKFDFILEIPNTETNVIDQQEALRQFIFQMMGKRADLKKLEPLINQKYKEVKRLNFMYQVKSLKKIEE